MSAHDPRTEAGLRALLGGLADRDADVARALERLGHPEPRSSEPGFGALLRIVSAQQISTHAAAAIWGRVSAMVGDPALPEAYLALPDEDLRAAGFSMRKVGYGRALARAFAEGQLATEHLAGLSDEEAIARITQVPGFGRWSAEIYLLFALGRADAFPAGDLAVRLGYAKLKRLDAPPGEKELRRLAEPWAGARGAGAVLLWKVYGAATLDG